MKNSLAILVVFLFVLPSWGSCPDWINTAPFCPPGNNTLVSEHYPALAHILSDPAGMVSPGEGDYVPTMVERIFQNSGDRIPLIVLPMTRQVYESVRRRVTQLSSDALRRQRLLDSLIFIENQTAPTWQQDYFESFVTAQGKISLRQIAGMPLQTARIAQALQSRCPELVEVGESLPAQTASGYTAPSSSLGGNLEGLPGGLCLFGGSHSYKNFAYQYCGSAKNTVYVDSSFLKLEHVDEILGVVRTRNGQEPCNFAITYASPSRALEVLRQNPNERWMEVYSNQTPAGPATLQRERLLSEPYRRICELIEHSRLRSVPRQTKTVQAPRTHTGNQTRNPETASRSENLRGVCARYTNQDLLSAIERSPEFRRYNELVEETMQRNRETIAEALRRRLPQCRVPFIPLPSLFYGGAILDRNGHRVLPPNTARAIFPNPTNAVVVEGSVITPHPQNQAFARDITQALTSAGVDNSFIDTFDYLHTRGGNAHCASHAIRYCRRGSPPGRSPGN